jgi:hypothetical protein
MVGLSALARASPADERPKRAVLFIIDGLHWEAPEKLGLRNIQALARQGVSFRQAWLVPPAHPHSGAWADIHNASIPNPVMLAGTVFLHKGHRMIQHQFQPDTAHVNNCPEAYVSLNPGNTYIHAKDTEDVWAVEQAIRLLESEPITFMRIHLQDTGRAGYACSVAQGDEPYKKNIWGKGSPYIEKAKEADRLLGRFVNALKKMNKYDDTLLVVTADHGQASTGWHPPHLAESAITPLVFVGPGVAKGKVLPYADHIDIVPTICHIMGKDLPNANGGCGRVLSEILVGAEAPAGPRRQYMKELNQVLREYWALAADAEKRADGEPRVAKALAESKENIYNVDRFLSWHEAGTLDSLIKHNRKVVKGLRNVLASHGRQTSLLPEGGKPPLTADNEALWSNAIDLLSRINPARNRKGVNPSDDKNPTGVKRGAFLEVGHKHTAVVQVRKKSIMGYLDGQLITQWKGDWKDLSFPEWVSRTQLEIATYSATVFHSIEVLEVTGVGTGLWPSYTCKRDACTKRALSCEKPVDEGKNRSSRHFHNTWLPLTLRRSMRWGLARVELGAENVDQRLI